MKRLIVAVSAAAVGAVFLFAQGRTFPPGGNHWQEYWGWEPPKPPPIALPDAYALVLAHIGSATNRFCCVTASCLEMTNYGHQGSAFSFSDTNGQHARVQVTFDKELYTDPGSRQLLGAK
jgi:hypothetical protein